MTDPGRNNGPVVRKMSDDYAAMLKEVLDAKFPPSHGEEHVVDGSQFPAKLVITSSGGRFHDVEHYLNRNNFDLTYDGDKIEVKSDGMLFPSMMVSLHRNVTDPDRHSPRVANIPPNTARG